MRQDCLNIFFIKTLSLTLGLTLLACVFPSITLASVYNNVSIVHHETLPDSSTYAYRIRLQLENREETLLLNRSEAFNDLNLLTVGTNSWKDQNRNNDTAPHSSALHDISIYAGQIENVSNSWARLVTQGDHVSGIIDTGNERLHLNNFVAANQIRQIHSQLGHQVDKPLTAPADANDVLLRETRDVVEIDIGNSFFNKPEKVTKVASIAIVVDSEYDEAIGGRGLAQAISTINAVDGIYREEFGLALKVETAIMITDSETLSLGDISLEDNLSRFRDYRLNADQISKDLALVHLFTGVLTADPSVGLAYIDTVCRTNGYDVSLSLPFRYPILLTAHEIGHNLGALHDDETNQCTATTDNLMFSHINDESTRTFSSCSIDAISKRLEQSTCHADAIDADLTLARQDDTGLIALVTNTDTVRAFPSARLSIEMTNATIASAPANCNVSSDTSVQCAVSSTFAEESQSFVFDLRLDQSQEVSINARLDPEGFVDVQNINNFTQIVIPQVIVTTQNDPPNDDENPDTADATGDDTTGGNAGASGGGSLTGIELFFAILLLTGARRARGNRGSSISNTIAW